MKLIQLTGRQVPLMALFEELLEHKQKNEEFAFISKI